ncbi:MAG: hypothetical protein AAGA32_21615 [Pseudomonadota bacterium]
MIVVELTKPGADGVEEDFARRKMQLFNHHMVHLKANADGMTSSPMKTAFMSNYSGLKGHVSDQNRRANDVYVRVWENNTKINHLMGKIWKSGADGAGKTDISEVVGNMDKAHDESDVSIQAMQTLAKERNDLTAAHDQTDKYRPFDALGCLFAWAAQSSPTVTLTANTYGLIALYSRYGFVISGQKNRNTQAVEKAVQRHTAALTALETEKDAKVAGPKREEAKERIKACKFSNVDQGMELSATGRTNLARDFVDGENWVSHEVYLGVR